jgi:DNA-binding transcriptional ArsR family regulator
METNRSSAPPRRWHRNPLSIFRLLVATGPQGLPVGAIAEKLGLANATLSFHLKELTSAGLTIATPSGRSIIYAASFETMGGLVEYLTENCCAGASCATGTTAIAACTPVSVKNPLPIQTEKTETLPSHCRQRSSTEHAVLFAV